MKYIKTYESIRGEYSKIGVENYYLTKMMEYKNPHEPNIQKCLDCVNDKIDIGYFLDLSCGNGEVSKYLSSIGFNNFKGSDPYFYDKYQKEIKKECFNYSFQDISKKGLLENFDTIVCSYALHLCPKSYFNNLMYQLSRSCKYFILISPSKYPVISDDYFYLDESSIYNRTHCKIFKSKIS